MPAYNGEKYIGTAIERILEQTYSNIELIIIEDCSTDNTLDIIGKYHDERIQLIKNKQNMGIAYSTNLAIEKCSGKYIALHDDDDVSTINRIELSVKFLEDHNEIDIVGGGSLTIDACNLFIRNNITPRSNPKVIKAMLLFRCLDFYNSTAMLRKDFVQKNVLSYKDGYLGMQDYQFYVEASKVGMISSIPNILLYHRQHDCNETLRQKTDNKSLRSKKYAEIQRNSLYMSGFRLSDYELQIINEQISEQMKPYYSLNELEDLKRVFVKIIRQAEEMQIDWLDELRWQCRKLLSERLVRTDLL